jgi:preprotein translocase subunit SecF
MMNISKHYKTLFAIPAFFSVLAILAILLWGLKPGIDLAGGSLMQVSYGDPVPTAEAIQTAVAPLNLGEVRVQPTGTNGFTLRQRDLSSNEKIALENTLGGLGTMHEDQFNSVGPSIGNELLQKGLIALALVSLCIILFIAFAFRHVSRPVSSWVYGVIAIITLFHDVLIPAGLFAFLGHVRGAEVDSLFIVGLLTILGISINDTIVVFDRVRENLKKNIDKRIKEDFGETVGKSIMQTLSRSINTSLTVVIMLFALFFLGPVTTKDFALTLIVGMIAGTYSSILLSSPLLIAWERYQRAK